MSNPYPIPQYVYDTLVVHPDWSGKKLADELGLKGRTARRYVKKWRDGEATPKKTVYDYQCPTLLPVVDSLVTNRSRTVDRPSAVPELLKAAVFDIETTSFGTSGYAEHLITCCILPLGADKPETYSITFEDRGDDLRLLQQVVSVLNKYTILIGHNCAGFDSNWLNSKLIFNRLPPLTTKLVVDTYQVAKSLSLKTSKGLGNLTDYFGLDGEKTTIYRTSWGRVFSPHYEEFSEGLREIEDHCQKDVLANRKLFDWIMPYALSMGTNPLKLSKFRYVDWSKVTE